MTLSIDKTKQRTLGTQPETRIPRATGLPLFGNLFDLMSDPLKFYEHLYKTLGPVVRFGVVGSPTYMVADPKLIEQILMSTGKEITKGYDHDVALKALLGNGLVTSEGPFWFKQRKTAAPAFNHHRLANYAETMVSLTEDVTKSWRDGQLIDLHEQLLILTLRVITNTLFGVSLGQDEKEFLIASQAELENYVHLQYGPTRFLPTFVPSSQRDNFYKAIEKTDRFIYQIIEKHRKNEINSDFISMMMQAEDEHGNHLSDQQLRDEVNTMIMAGHETTANALVWTLILLSRNPHIDLLLAAELKQQLGYRSPNFSDLKLLPYTEAVIKEAMRLYPPAWSVSRYVTKPIELNGHEIEAGATLEMPQWIVHRSEAHFIEPLKFRPERWLNGETANLHKFAYFPFGGGPRVCIGNAFAMMEATLILATLRSKYHILVQNKDAITTRPSITLGPAQPVMTLLRRVQPDRVGCPL